MKVKICGITNSEDALAAADLGADALGFIFVPSSPRSVSPRAARKIIQALPPFVVAVGVVADMSSERIKEIIEMTGVGCVQLHGNEPPGLLKKIPRSGSWLLWVEHLFGVILLGAALFYFTLAVAPKLSMYAVPVTLIAGGVYLGFLDKSGKEKVFLKRIQWIAGLMAIASGLLFAYGLQNKGITWESYSEAELSKAVQDRLPVMIDFYADWCIPCMELDRNTWTDAEVLRATSSLKKIKVDLTHFDSPESEAVRKKFNISGVPTIIFIKADGTEAVDLRTVGFIPPRDILLKLKGL